MLTAMTSNEEHRETIQRMLLDTRRQLSNAADRDIFAMWHCQIDQVISPACSEHLVPSLKGGSAQIG